MAVYSTLLLTFKKVDNFVKFGVDFFKQTKINKNNIRVYYIPINNLDFKATCIVISGVTKDVVKVSCSYLYNISENSLYAGSTKEFAVSDFFKLSINGVTYYFSAIKGDISIVTDNEFGDLLLSLSINNKTIGERNLISADLKSDLEKQDLVLKDFVWNLKTDTKVLNSHLVKVGILCNTMLKALTEMSEAQRWRQQTENELYLVEFHLTWFCDCFTTIIYNVTIDATFESLLHYKTFNCEASVVTFLNSTIDSTGDNFSDKEFNSLKKIFIQDVKLNLDFWYRDLTQIGFKGLVTESSIRSELYKAYYGNSVLFFQPDKLDQMIIKLTPFLINKSQN